jgi:DNA-binding XRE family transcriptional regulator
MPSAMSHPLWWARLYAGLTQRDLAEAVGACRQTISDIERGASLPNVSLALAIARRVERDVADLFGADDLR